MGSGKSSVGRALASLLEWHFVDLDAAIEKAEGRKIREIFGSEGESRFREIEAAKLRLVLATGPRPMVLATGGGTYVQERNAVSLRTEGALVVFLEASPEILMRRCCADDVGDGVRPLARDRDAFIRLYEQRLPCYRTADLTVSSDHKAPQAVAQEIVHTLGLLKM